MVQIIQRRPQEDQKKANVQGFIQGASALGDAYSQYKQQEDQKKLISQENAAIKQNYGIDLAGIHDPKQRARILGEKLKQEGKEKSIQDQLDMIAKLREKKPAVDIAQEGIENKFQQPSLKSDNELGDEEILSLTAHNPALGKELREQKNESRREKERDQTSFQKEREYHTQFTKPILESANKTLESLPAKKGLSRQWKQDIASKNTSGLGQFLVDKTGAEFWRDPAAARAKAASKHYFVESLQTLSPGTRPNQFIEQQLQSAQPAIGRDVESGLTVMEMSDFLDDLQEEKAKTVLKLAEEDMEKHGYERKDIGTRAQKEMQNYVEKRQNEMAFNIRKIHEDQLDDRQLADEISFGKIPPGAPLTPRAAAMLMIKNNDNVDAAIKEAKSLGFELPKKRKEIE